MSGETAVVDQVLRVLVVGDSSRIDAAMDALSTQFESVSLFRERTLSNAIDRLETVTVHCAVYAFDETDERSTVDRLHERAESLPIVAVVDERTAARALEAGATDVVTPDEPDSLVAARVRTAAERERYRLSADASASKYRSILEGSNALVWVLDADGEIAYASPAVESRLGVTPDELERRRPTRFVHPDDRDDACDAFESVSSGPFGAVERVTARLRSADGSWRLADLHAVNRLADPLVGGVVVTITSAVPDEPRTDDVRESLDRLDDALFVLGPRWELRYANDAAAALLEGDPRPGAVVWDVLPEAVRHPFAERLREAQATDAPVAFETTYPDLDGPLRVRAVPAGANSIVYARESAESDATTDRDRLALLESVVDALDDGVVVLEDSTVALANARLFELAGADELVGRELGELFDDELAAAVRERARSPVVRWTDPIPGDLTLAERRPVGVFVAPIPNDDRTLCIVRDRRRSPAGALSTVEEAVATIRDADSRSTVRRAAVDAALELTGAGFAGFYLVDEASLTPSAVATREPPTPTDLPSVDRSTVPVEELLESGASIHDRQPFEAFLSRSGVDAERVATVPVGNDLLIATGAEPLAFDGVALAPVETLAGIAAVALDDLEHAARASERRRERDAFESALERFRRLRSIERELLRANTRRAVDRRLCEGLASLELDGGSIELAWVSDAESGGETIHPRELAGRGESYLEAVSIPRDPSAGEPTGRTAATREPTVVERIEDGDDPWRERALERGFRSALSVPLVLDEFLYGTLTVYADGPNAFDKRTRRAIEHLAAVAASVVGAIEARRALLSDEVTELELVIRDETEPLTAVATRLDRSLEVRSVVPRSSGGSVVFATVAADDPESFPGALAGLEAVESVRSVGTRGDDVLVELVLAESSVAAAVADHGGVARSVAPTDDRVRLVVELSNTVDVRSFVRMLERRYPGTELVARRDRERSPETGHTFDSVLRDRLSERQYRTLEAAYYGGFFEWPRESTGEEIAGSLDVSQPTFSRHVRLAQGKLFSLLFEEFEEFDGLE